MTIEIATRVGPARIDIAYERLGDPGDPPVLLIMGLGAQLITWPDGLCDALLAEHLQLVRFDNRDAGQSTHFHDAPMPNMAAALAGDRSSASYMLSDMAGDAVGLLDVLGFASAHVVGCSLGGFVAQTIAIEHPRRVRSLVSMMSSTGSLAVGQPHGVAMRAMAGAVMTATTPRDAVIERTLALRRVINSPGYPTDERASAELAGRAFDRGYDPLGLARQAVAVIASGDRTARLRELDVPTLVVHGAADPVCDVGGGRATAEAIAGAELVVIDGMGHDLPRALWPRFVAGIAETVRRGEARATA